jgi:hypothetical protein
MFLMDGAAVPQPHNPLKIERIHVILPLTPNY